MHNTTPPVPPPAPPAPVPPPAPPAIGADGKLGENWFIALGDEFSAHAKDLGKHKDLRSVLTELDYFRKNGVEYPVMGASPAVIDRFRAITGVPETPEGYALGAELPEGMTFDTEMADVIQKAAHAAHTPPAALTAIAGEFSKLMAKRLADNAAAEAATKKAAQDELVTSWRGDYERNASTVRHLTGKLAEAAGLMLDDPNIAIMANNPSFARMMIQVARLTSEDRIQTPAGLGDLRSPADRIKMIQNGTDPVWGEKYKTGNTQDKQAAYEFIGQLRARAAQ